MGWTGGSIPSSGGKVTASVVVDAVLELTTAPVRVVDGPGGARAAVASIGRGP